MRVLTDPVETGAVTIALPQDVQAEAFDWPVELFAERVWRVARPLPEQVDIADAAAVVRAAKRPLIVAGGGVHYSGAEEALRALVRGDRHPGRRDARRARARCRTATRRRWAPSARPARRPPTRSPPRPTSSSASAPAGATSRPRRGPPSRTRVSGSSTSTSRGFDAGKHAGLSVVADAREALTALAAALEGYAVGDPPTASGRPRCGPSGTPRSRRPTTRRPRSPTRWPTGLLTQGQVLGAVNELTDPRDVVLCAAGSMPGDLHKLWRVRDRKAYHVEYGYSCMGYEVPASIGIRLADETPRRLRHGRRRRLPDDADRARHRRAGAGQGDRRPRAEPRLPLDRLALGVARLAAVRHELPLPRRADRPARRRACCPSTSPRTPAASAPTSSRCTRRTSSSRRSRRPRRLPPTAAPSSSTSRPTRSVYAPDSDAWWDVPVSSVSELDSTQTAYAEYTDHKSRQRPLLGPAQSASVYRKTGEEK